MVEELAKALNAHATGPDDERFMMDIQKSLMMHAKNVTRALYFARRYQMLTSTGATRTAKNAARAGLFAALDELEKGE